MHTLGQGESRDGPIGTLGRSGRRLRTNRSAAVLGCCKNLRVSYDRHAHSVRRGGGPGAGGVRCPAASKAAVVKIDWNSAFIRRSVRTRGMIMSW